MFLSPAFPVAGRQQFRCGNHWPGAEDEAKAEAEVGDGDGNGVWTILFLGSTLRLFTP